MPKRVDTIAGRLLAKVRLAWMLSALMSGILLTGAVGAGLMLTAILADNLFLLPPPVRWVALGLCLAGTGAALAVSVFARMPLFVGRERIASHFEQHVEHVNNDFINSVQFAIAGHAPADGTIAGAYLSEAAGRLGAYTGWEAFDGARLVRNLKRAGAAAAVVAVYALLFPGPFAMGLQRLGNPATTMTVSHGLRLSVEPGDITIAEGADVTVRAAASGRAASVTLEYEDDITPQAVKVPMTAGEGVYVASMRAVRKDRQYRVVAVPAADQGTRLAFRSPEARPARSSTYTVTTVPPPRIERLDLAYSYPPHTGREPDTQADASGDVKAPVGTRVTLHGTASKPLIEAAAAMPGGALHARVDGTQFTLEFSVDTSCTYHIRLLDEDGYENVSPVSHTIAAVPDSPPRVDVLSPEGDVVAGAGSKVPLVFEAEDEYGLIGVWLLAAVGDDDSAVTLKAYEDGFVHGGRRLGKSTEVNLGLLDLEESGGCRVWLVAADNAPDVPQQARSRTINIRLGAAGTGMTQEISEDLLTRIRALLDRQAALNEATADGLQETVELRRVLDVRAPGFRDAALDQQAIRDTAIAVSQDAENMKSGGQAARVLSALAAAEMITVREGLTDLAGPRLRPVDQTGAQVMKAQFVIVRQLEMLLGRLDQEAESAPGMVVEEAEESAETAHEARKKTEEVLKEFIEAERKIIEQTNNLSPESLQDLTGEEVDAFKDVAVAQDELSKFLEELVSDLSELPEQDFTSPTLSEELVEILAEVELAEDALEMQNKTMAVTAEQTGVELAEELVHDLPRWLSDMPDKLKWDMEEPPSDYDVPMAELPAELYDMMGDLIDEEAAMTEEIEDESSSWADSIDAGAGWMAMDGPISNMSAKGITGNLLPNSSEIGGRSGEGRTGRAHGEFVEQTAQGKGGRMTPTRLTPDAFESGAVEDSSTDPMGGATGGGKLSGAGGEGLPGPVPPDVQNTMKRLAGQQADIRARAQQLQFKLDVVNIPSPELDQAIEVMQSIEDDLGNYRYQNVLPKKKMLVDTMRESHESLRQQIHIRGERNVFLPKNDQVEILEALDEDISAEYRDMVAEYFRKLAQAQR